MNMGARECRAGSPDPAGAANAGPAAASPMATAARSSAAVSSATESKASGERSRVAGSGDPTLHQAAPSSALSRVTIEPATAGDAPAIAALLREAGLPDQDFAPHLAHFLVARRGGVVVGAVGAEVCGRNALLRSLVVAPVLRGSGWGEALLTQLEKSAVDWGVQRWWLLTTTAESFFLKRGFRHTPRAAAPIGIAGTEEFRGLCPSVAVCLSRERRFA